MSPPVPTTLEPGAAFGISFISGDFDIAGIGTITYMENNRVLTLGHPMFKLGEVAFPLTTAWIYDFIPSYSDSEKMGSVMTPVGVVDEDTAFGGSGTLGGQPNMIPCEVSVRDLSAKLTHDYKFQVVQNDQLTPLLVTMGVTSALDAAFDSTGLGMVTSTFTLDGTKGAHVTHTNTSYFEGSPMSTIAEEMVGAATLFKYNVFSPQQIKSVHVEATLSNRDDTAMIERAYAERTTVRAGEPLNLHVLVRPWGGEPVDYPLTLNLPADMPPTTLQVAVAGGSQVWTMRSLLHVLTPDFDSLQGVLDQFATTDNNTVLLAMAANPREGASVGGTILPQLPQSFGPVLAAEELPHFAQGSSELVARQQLPWMLYGGTVVTVTVEDRNGTRPQVGTKGEKKGEKSAEEAAAAAAAGETTPPPPPSPTPTKPEPAKPGDLSFAGAQPSSGDAAWPQSPPASLWWAASALRPDIAARLRALAPREADPALPPGGPGEPPSGPGVSPGEPPTPPGADASEAGGESAKPDETKPGGDDEAAKQREEEAAKEEGLGRVLRQPAEWVQTAESDFSGGTAEGVGYGSQGSLFLLPNWTTASLIPGATLLAAACGPDGTLYYSQTGGQIFRLHGDQPEKFCDTGEFAVTALAIRADGTLLAGCSPSGKVLEISPQGQVKTLCALPVTYVWDLSPASGGDYFAATGSDGIIFRVHADGTFATYVRLPVGDVLALAQRGDDLIAATAQPGGVFDIDAHGTPRALLGFGEDDDVTCLAVTAAGEIYAGTSPGGKVCRVDPAGQVTTPYESTDTPVYALLAAPEGVYVGAAADGKMLLLRPEEQNLTLQLREEPTVYTRVVADGQGHAYALANLPAGVLRANLQGAQEGAFNSSVLDAERRSTWGKINWQATVPAGASLEVRCRSGNTEDPGDGSWSAWSRPYANGDQVDAPAARYLQYRVAIKGAAAPVEVERVAVSYLPVNQPPKLEFKAPDSGAAIKGKFTISWSGSDDDDDALSTDLYYRAEGTTDWLPLAAGVTAEEYDWDTTTVSGGWYEIKAVINDRRSNPIGWLEGTTYLRHIIVDNDAPSLTVKKVQAGEGWSVSGTALDQGSGLVSVAWKLASDEGDSAVWTAVVPDGQVFTPALLSFTIPAEQIPAGTDAITVRAMDAAGNYTDQEVQFVEKPATTQTAAPAAPAAPAETQDAAG
jgi:hypothetical protein